MAERSLSTVAFPPVSDQIFEAIHFQPHVFKTEQSFSYPYSATIKQDKSMIWDWSWKNALEQAIEMILPIN